MCVSEGFLALDRCALGVGRGRMGFVLFRSKEVSRGSCIVVGGEMFRG